MYPDRPDPIGPAGASYRTTRKAVVGAIFCAAILSALTPRAAGLDHRVFDTDSIMGKLEIEKVALDEDGSAYFLVGFWDPASPLPPSRCTNRRYSLMRFDPLAESLTTVHSEFPSVVKLLCDRRHRLWTIRNRSVYQQTGDSAIQVLGSHEDPHNFSDMVLDRMGCIWVAGEAYLGRIDTAGVITDFSDRVDSIPGVIVGPLHIATNGDLWAGVAGRQDAPVFALQIHQGEWTLHPLRAGDAQIDRVLSVTSTADGRVWLSVSTKASHGQLLCYGDGEWSAIEIPLLPDAPPGRPKSFPNLTRAGTLASEGNRVWAVLNPDNGLPTNRLMSYDPADSAWSDSPFIEPGACAKKLTGGQQQGQIWVAEFRCGYSQSGRLHRFRLDD